MQDKEFIHKCAYGLFEVLVAYICIEQTRGYETDMALYLYNYEPSPAQNSIIELKRSECIALCAEPGMGKTSCLTRAVMAWLQRGDNARYIDFAGSSIPTMISELRKIGRMGGASSGRTIRSATGTKSLIACDNLVAGDESDAERTTTLLKKYLEEGMSIAIAITPENEMLLEQLGPIKCYWSCDLRLTRPTQRGDGLVYDLYANGIPCLVDALSKVKTENVDAVGTDASYQEPYVSMVASCVRGGMMMEEKRLRLAMLLLGTGNKKDLVEILGELDEDLWLMLVRDSPFLGADASTGTFACVGSHSFDCLYLAYAPLNAMSMESPWLVASVSRSLMSRGNYSRAAIVGSMCADVEQRCSLLLESGPQMIEAGESAIVADALEEAHEQGLVHSTGYRESACVLAAVMEGHKSPVDTSMNDLEGGTQRGMYARAVAWCVSLHKGSGLFGDAPFDAEACMESKNATMEALVAHGSMMGCLASCDVVRAYKLMLGMSVRLREGRVSAAIAQMDYMLCSLVNGIVPSALDVETMDQHKLFLERSGLTSLIVAYDAMMASCRLLAGRIAYDESLEAHIQRADRAGHAFVRGLLLVVASVADLRIGALTRSHVRLLQALGVFVSLDLPALVAVTRLLDIALRAELGERILRPEVQSCRGASENIDKVVTIVAAALSSSDRKRRVGAGRWGIASCPRDVLWLANVLMNDCGGFSRQVSAVMPIAWKDSVLRATAEVDEFFGIVSQRTQGNNLEGGPKGDPGHGEEGETADRPVSVSLLGRFEMSVEGLPVSLARLERRRSKALLALLASVPGHKAKRFVIMESIWPSHDYDSANKCLYSATSVIRKVIGSLIESEEEVVLVSTNKTEGTVSLNTTAFCIDVDEFEARARKLVDVEGEDRLVVSTCREIEDLYKGDLFISPTDGMGVVETRSRELRTLFADAMITGALAAENLGMKSLACRFARKAHDADNMREDAVRALVITLCSAGRHAEAERAYEQFVGRVVDFTKRPPSRHLREVVDELLHRSMRRSGLRRQNGAMPDVAEVSFEEESEGQLSFAFEDDANYGEGPQNG